jgi:hypothetical protein
MIIPAGTVRSSFDELKYGNDEPEEALHIFTLLYAGAIILRY